MKLQQSDWQSENDMHSAFALEVLQIRVILSNICDAITKIYLLIHLKNWLTYQLLCELGWPPCIKVGFVLAIAHFEQSVASIVKHGSENKQILNKKALHSQAGNTDANLYIIFKGKILHL